MTLQTLTKRALLALAFGALVGSAAACDDGGAGGRDGDVPTDGGAELADEASPDVPGDVADEASPDVAGDTADETSPDVVEDTADEAADGEEDGGAEDADIPEGSLGPGASCTESEQCAGDAICVSGEYTAAYCAPLCTDNAECQDEATGMCGMCSALGGYQFCMYYCQLGRLVVGCTYEAVCPGDMECDGAVCR
jgi:hypothetical protein